MNVASAQKPLELKIQNIGQKILAHLSPEAGDLRVHWLATTRSLVTGPKNNGHERRSTRTSSVAITYRDRIQQRSPQGVDVTLPIWDPRNQLARATASGTPWRPVRARDRRRAHPRQDRSVETQGHEDGAGRRGLVRPRAGLLLRRRKGAPRLPLGGGRGPCGRSAGCRPRPS
jgi:hypothetical protein